MNQLVVVGRLASDPVINEAENGKKVSYITLAVHRPYKNEEGIYEIDFIPCLLWNGIAEHTNLYCNKGDVIGVRGMLQIREGQLVVVADKVSFLSSQKKEEE